MLAVAAAKPAFGRRQPEEPLAPDGELRYEGGSLSFPLELGPTCGRPMSVIDLLFNGHADLVTAGALQPGA